MDPDLLTAHLWQIQHYLYCGHIPNVNRNEAWLNAAAKREIRDRHAFVVANIEALPEDRRQALLDAAELLHDYFMAMRELAHEIDEAVDDASDALDSQP